MLLTDKGEVLTCGTGLFGRLGHGDDTSNQLVPKVLASLVRDKNRVVGFGLLIFVVLLVLVTMVRLGGIND